MEPLSCPHCYCAFGPEETVTCPGCGSRYSAGEAQEVAFLLTEVERLKTWGGRGLISFGQEQRLLGVVRAELQAARGRAAGTPAVFSVALEPRVAPLRRREPIPARPKPGDDPISDLIEPAGAREAAPPQPVSKPRPAMPAFSWSRLGGYLLSERTLNGLLGLGAFLILAAGVVISTLNPTRLATLPHLIATIATAVVLYGSGYYVRQKLQLLKAGTALLGIGAAFIPLVVWTLGRDTALSWDTGTIWLVATTLCLPIYLGSHILLHDRTFAALAVIAGGSEALAVAHRAGLPLEWGVCALVALAAGYLFLSVRIRIEWPVLSWALFWSAQIITPLAMVALIAGKMHPDLWRACAGQPPSASFDYAVGAVWWLGAGFYLLTSWLRRQRAWAFASAATALVSYGLVLERLHVSADIWPLAWSLIALPFLLIAETLMRRRGQSTQGPLAAILGLQSRTGARDGGAPAAYSLFTSPSFVAAYASALFALGWATIRWWNAPAIMGVRDLGAPVIVALLALAGICIISAVTRRTSFFLYPAVWLLLVALTSAAYSLLHGAGLDPSGADWARIIALLDALYVAAGAVVDRAGKHFSRPVYLVGYALSVLTMFLSALDRAATVQVVGLSLLIYAWSAWRVPCGRHPAFLWLVGRLFRRPESAGFRTARAGFLYLACWLFPVWLLLAISLAWPATGPEGYGIALTLLAAVYAYLGRAFARLDRDYCRPWYLAGYAMSGLGPLAAIADRTLFIGALAVSIGLYAGSAVVSRRATWLYPVVGLVPLLFWQILERLGTPPRYDSLAFVALGVLYSGAGVLLHHGSPRRALRPIRNTIGSYALPFFLVSYALSGLGLALVGQEARWMVMVAFSIVGMHCAASAALFRQSLFMHAVAGAFAVVYVIGLISTPLEARYYGLALLPGLAACLAVAETLRRRLDSRDLTQAQRGPWRNLGVDSWSAPFWIVVLAGTIAMPAYARLDWPVLAGSLLAAGVLFLVATAVFRHPWWLYPAIGAGLAGQLAGVHAIAPSLSIPDIATTFIAPVWLLLWLSYGIARRQRDGRSANGVVGLWSSSWARPLLHAGIAALAGSTAATLTSPSAGLETGSAYMLLLAGFSVLCRSEVAAFGGVILMAVVIQEGLRLAGVPLIHQPPIWAAAALVATLASFAPSREPGGAYSRAWARPLRVPIGWGSMAASAMAMPGSLAYEALYGSRASLEALALTTGVVGLTLVAHGFRRRDRILSYLGVAGLLAAGMLELAVFKVGQPQAFVLPAGVYLLTIAFLESTKIRGQGNVKAALESTGIVLLLGTSILQAVGLLGVGADRYAYDTFLLVESAAIFALGAAIHWKKSFFAGAAALITDVVIMLADPMRAMNTWYLVALIGFVMIGLVLFAEKRRSEIPVWFDQWRDRLETWA